MNSHAYLVFSKDNTIRKGKDNNKLNSTIILQWPKMVGCREGYRESTTECKERFNAEGS